MSDKLPDGWRWAKLGDVIRDVQTGFACGERAEDGIIQIRMNNVAANGDLAWQKVLRVPHDFTDMAKYYLNDGDILFNHTNSAELVGKSAVYRPSSEPAVFSNHFFRVSPHEEVLDRAYLARWLIHCQRSGLFTQICNRWVGQAAVPKKKLLELSMPLPSLNEQHRIVARLEEQLATAERARSAALAQLAAIEAMPQALLRQIFPRSPSASLTRRWRWAKLGEVCDVEKGRTPKKDWYAPTGAWLVHYRDVATHGITWTAGRNTFVAPEYESSLKELEPGTVLVGADAHDPATIGKKVTLVDTVPQHASPAYFAGEMLGIRPNAQRSIEPAIVWHWLRSEAGYEEMQQNVSGGHLNVRPARNVRIPLPPVNEQHRIVQELDEQTAAIERARAAAQAQLAALDALPAAVLRLAFTP